MPNQTQIERILSDIIDQHTEQSIAQSVTNIDIDDDQVTIDLELNYPANSHHSVLIDSIQKKLSDNQITQARVNITTKIYAYEVRKEVSTINNVKNIIAIASGKGGVGKSTTAVNLALALHAEGARVALLDADIYGPSQPRMLGIHKQRPEGSEEGKLIPVIGHGIQSMSIGFLVDENSPMIWRGPMVTQALEQLLRDTVWQEVDYMIIDLPPGTGDTQLTLSQRIPVSGAIIITTPQDIALLDARRGLKMFEKVNVPILGIIENMCLHICPKCGHEEAIFGRGGGEQLAAETATKFLGALPLESDIRTSTDGGNPTVVSDPASRSAQIYLEIARKASAKLCEQNKAAEKFPNIIIE